MAQTDTDVLIIGGGINGAATAQCLSAQGYRVILAEAQGFAAGASSKSSRLMHFGLRYLDRGEPLWNYVRNPGWFLRQCRRAQTTMAHRAELVRTMANHLIPYQMYLPIFADDTVAPWQMATGLRLVNALSRTDCPVVWRRLPPADWSTDPVCGALQSRRDLRAAFVVTEYQYDWPERLVCDYIADARRLGADCRDYTQVTALTRDDQTLQATFANGQTATASRVINMAGAWIDRVLETSSARPSAPLVAATKGSHIAVRLPPAWRGRAIAHFASTGYPFYIIPFRDLHYIGPTETPLPEMPDQADALSATADEIDWLVAETRRLVPGLGLSHRDVLYSWAGARPMPHVPNYRGKQNLVPVFHDHETDGLPGVLSVPGGPLMLHRFTARTAAAKVSERLTPQRPPQEPNLGSPEWRDQSNSPPVVPDYPHIRFAHLLDIVQRDQPTTLSDILLRQSGLVWTGGLTPEIVTQSAHTVSDAMGWTKEGEHKQIAACLTDLDRSFHRPAPSPSRPTTRRRHGNR